VPVGAALCLLVGGCASGPAPPPLVTSEVAPAERVDPAAPCTRGAPAGAPVEQPGPVGVAARFDRAGNTVVLTGGQGVTLAALSGVVNDPAALRELAPGEWLLGADLVISPGASLRITAPAVRWLKLASGPGGYVSVRALGGAVEVEGACVTSWDSALGRVDTDYLDGRGFLLARDGGRMSIAGAEIRYLGHGEVESYGLSWRVNATGGVTDSVVSHNYFGLYTAGVDGWVAADNEVHDSVLYGIDPHTGSKNLRIERNVVHDNGKHGIILAEDCTDSVIRENVVYRNQHHGIVLYLRSDRNLIEGNASFGNLTQGININESADNVIRANRVYENDESGIGVGKNSTETLVEGNQIRRNREDGVRLFSAAAETEVRANVIGENLRYGVYVDSGGAVQLTGNTIFGSRTGILVKGQPPIPEGDNELYDNTEADIKTG
jgi:parallel beta-helix repeat protein